MAFFLNRCKVPFWAVEFQSILIERCFFIPTRLIQVTWNYTASSTDIRFITVLQTKSYRRFWVPFCRKTISLTDTSMITAYSRFTDCNAVFHPCAPRIIISNHSYESCSVCLTGNCFCLHVRNNLFHCIFRSIIHITIISEYTALCLAIYSYLAADIAVADMASAL